MIFLRLRLFKRIHFKVGQRDGRYHGNGSGRAVCVRRDFEYSPTVRFRVKLQRMCTVNPICNQAYGHLPDVVTFGFFSDHTGKGLH